MVILSAFAAVLGFLGLCVLAGLLVERRGRALRKVNGELDRHRRFIDGLRERAWQHRDVDPALATIVLDEIQKFKNPKEIA
jgi:hypothetical protein